MHIERHTKLILLNSDIEYMATFRRTLLTGSLALLAGCTGFQSSNKSESTASPTEEYSLDDLRIYNGRDRAVAVTLTLVPDEETDPSMELFVRIPPEEGIIWDDNPLLDDPGHVTVTVDDGTGEPDRAEREWHGDTIEDNQRLSVHIDEDGVTVQQHVA